MNVSPVDLEKMQHKKILLLFLVSLTVSFICIVFDQTNSIEGSNLQSEFQIVREHHPATTGIEFTGNKIRTFQKQEFQNRKREFKLDFDIMDSFNDNNNNNKDDNKDDDNNNNNNNNNNNCYKWGVVTTVSKPSEAVRRFLYKTGEKFCLITFCHYHV